MLIFGVCSQVNDAELGWTVGYMLNTSNSLPPDYPTPPIGTVVFVLLIILFIIFILLALGFVLHARRVARQDASQYQRMATYGSI